MNWATCRERSSSKPRSTRRAPGQALTTGYGEGIGIILSYKPENTRPSTRSRFRRPANTNSNYATRPWRAGRFAFLVEGKLSSPQAAKERTGGWNPNTRRGSPGRLALEEGKNTIAIEAIGLLPHIDKLAILPLSQSQRRTVVGRAGTLAEVSQQRKLILEFATGWADDLRKAKKDDPLFGPWLAVKDLPDMAELAAAPLLAKYREKRRPGCLKPQNPRHSANWPLAIRRCFRRSQETAGRCE